MQTRIRAENNILVLTMSADKGLDLIKHLTEQGAAKSTTLKDKVGIGVKVTKDMSLDLAGGLTLFLWEGYQIIVAE